MVGGEGRGGGAEGDEGCKGGRDESWAGVVVDAVGGEKHFGRGVGSMQALRSSRKLRMNGILRLSGWNFLVGILFLLVLLPATVKAVELDQHDKVLS